MSERRGGWVTTLTPSVRRVRRARPVVRPRSGPVDLVAEASGDWSSRPTERPTRVPRTVGDDPVAIDPGATVVQDPGARLNEVAALADELAELRLDELDESDLRELLRRVQPTIMKLQALRTRAAGEMEARAVARAEPGRERRAEQDARRWLRKVGLTPSEAKQAGSTGRAVRDAPQLGAAHAAARISEAHTRIIADLVAWLPEDMDRTCRERFQTELIALAATSDVIAFGREARRRLAAIDLGAVEGRERRQHARRTVTIGDAEDGAVVGSFRLYGLQAEKLRTALDAARHQDPADGPFRSNEQRNADALEVLCDLALRRGELPTQHGVRPHVTVLVSWSELASEAGIAELDFTGPITIASLRPLLRDCSVSRIILDPDSVPTEAGESVRTVPAGLWRELVARDRGCSWHGCDAPAAWCEVAHGQIPFRRGGRLRLQDCALLCSRHHRKFDSEPWKLVILGPVVSYEPRAG